MDGRRSRRASFRRVQVGFLAVAVLAATAGGFVVLRQAFDGNRGPGIAAELPANGRIVFSSDVRDGDQLNVHLFSMEPDISAPMQLTKGHSGNYSPDVSPDGATIAFTHESYDSGEVVIATMSIDGSRPTWLTDPELVASNPAWSPDGTRIAFTGGRKQTQRIYVMNADGSDPHPITGDGIFLPEDPAWSPDGSLIAFRGSPTPPLAPEGPSAWDIYTIEPDGRRPANITNSPALESQPVWSPDGGSIAYTYSNLPDEKVFGIVVRRLSDGTETSLTDGPELDSDPVWSPDGRFVVFSRQPVVNGQFDLWQIRADGSAPRVLTPGGYGASWQPIPKTTGTPTPALPPSPDPKGRDIGLAFNLCNLEQLDGIDWHGDGADGSAWTGTRLRDSGQCAAGLDAEHVVAVDLDGDDLADTWALLICEGGCQPAPFDTTDLDRDGVDELVVIEQYFSAPNYRVYTLSPSVDRGEIAEVIVTGPGHPENDYVSGEPAILSSGGDAGISDHIRCIGWPDHTVIEQTRSYTPIDGDTTDVHYTRLVMETGGVRVIASDDFTQQASEPLPGYASDGQETPCGVDFDPGPR